MFDLDRIEKDWKENSFYLSNEDILEIFKEEGITKTEYDKEIAEFNARLPKYPSAEERMLANIFDNKEIKERIKKIDEERNNMYKMQYPKRKYLSQASQRKVVEGCMDVIFNNTRYWYNYFNGQISIEKIYYICLYSLFDSVKYCLHFSTKACFRAYVSEFIRRSIIKNIAKWEHISYRNAYYIVNNLAKTIDYVNSDYKTELQFDYDKETPFSPSFIYEQIKNNSYDVDYTSKISSDEFMADYEEALNDLTFDEKKVMELLYDSNGCRDFTVKQVSEFLVVEQDIIEKLKKSATKKLRQDNRFN